MSLDLRDQLARYGSQLREERVELAVEEVIWRGAKPVLGKKGQGVPGYPGTRPWLVGAAAFLIVVLVGAIQILQTDQPASSSDYGELVASMWEHHDAPGSFADGWLYLYADGRLLWERWTEAADPLPPELVAEGRVPGWKEERLSPKGVELIRSEIIATGLFDPDRPHPETDSAIWHYIQVRNGDRLVYFNGEAPELFERLAGLWSWLPADAWEDPEAKPFMPSRYAVCMQGEVVGAIDPTDHLQALPGAVREILAATSRLYVSEIGNRDPATMMPLDPDRMMFPETTGYCYDMTTEEARILEATLDEGGVERVAGRDDAIYIVSGSLPEPDEYPAFDAITLTFWPMLPHGVPAFTGA